VESPETLGLGAHTFKLEAPHDLKKLGYTHDLFADIRRSSFHSNYESRLAFWEEHHDKLGDERYQVILTIRLKIILLSYLLRVPAFVGLTHGLHFSTLMYAWQCLICQWSDGANAYGKKSSSKVRARFRIDEP
jgi:hypothetical protein